MFTITTMVQKGKSLTVHYMDFIILSNEGQTAQSTNWNHMLMYIYNE